MNNSNFYKKKEYYTSNGHNNNQSNSFNQKSNNNYSSQINGAGNNEASNNYLNIASSVNNNNNNCLNEVPNSCNSDNSTNNNSNRNSSDNDKKVNSTGNDENIISCFKNFSNLTFENTSNANTNNSIQSNNNINIKAENNKENEKTEEIKTHGELSIYNDLSNKSIYNKIVLNNDINNESSMKNIFNTNSSGTGSKNVYFTETRIKNQVENFGNYNDYKPQDEFFEYNKREKFSNDISGNFTSKYDNCFLKPNRNNSFKENNNNGKYKGKLSLNSNNSNNGDQNCYYDTNNTSLNNAKIDNNKALKHKPINLSNNNNNNDNLWINKSNSSNMNNNHSNYWMNGNSNYQNKTFADKFLVPKAQTAKWNGLQITLSMNEGMCNFLIFAKACSLYINKSMVYYLDDMKLSDLGASFEKISAFGLDINLIGDQSIFLI